MCLTECDETLIKKRPPEWILIRCGLPARIERPVARVSRRGIAFARDGRLQRQEAVMKPIIDLGSELLFDRSRVASPYLRLLVAAIGQDLVKGSPWVVVSRRALSVYCVPPKLMAGEPRRAQVA
jgi:hypothetical protein